MMPLSCSQRQHMSIIVICFFVYCKNHWYLSCQWKDSERANEESLFVSEKIQVWKML